MNPRLIRFGKDQKGSIDPKLQLLGAIGLGVGWALVAASNTSVGELLYLAAFGVLGVIAAKEIFGWQSALGLGWMKKYFESKLTTKNRRKSFVVSVLGLVLTFISLIFQPENLGDFLEAAFTSPSMTISPSKFQLLLFKVNLFSQIFWLGFVIFVLGLIGSFAFEETYGKIRKWINSGN